LSHQSLVVSTPRSIRLVSASNDVDVRQLPTSTSTVHLSAKPITVVPATAPAYNPGATLLAVNARFVCYTVRGSKIRALSRSTSARTLIRAHESAVTDLRFHAAVDDDLLVSVSRDGALGVWRLVLADPGTAAASASPDDGVVATLVAHVLLDDSLSAVDGFMRVLCPAAPAGGSPRVLALWHHATTGAHVALLDVDRISIGQLGVGALKMSDVPALSPQSRIFHIKSDRVAALRVNDLDVSASGMVIALACSDSTVQLISSYDGTLVSTLVVPPSAEPAGERDVAGVSAVRFAGASLTLLTATRSNTHFQLWNLATSAIVARLALVGGPIAREPSLLQLSADNRTLIVASTMSPHGYLVRLRDADADATGFSQVAEFALRQPIFSMTTFAAGDDEVQLYTVQPDCVQYLVVNPSACFEDDDAPAPLPAAAAPTTAATASIERVDVNGTDDDDDDDGEVGDIVDEDADDVTAENSQLRMSAEEISQALREEEERKRKRAADELEQSRRLETARDLLAKQQARHAALRANPAALQAAAEPAKAPAAKPPVDDAEERAKEERKRKLREDDEAREKQRLEALRLLKERASSRQSAAAPAPAVVVAAAAVPEPVRHDEPKVVSLEANEHDDNKVVEVIDATTPEPQSDNESVVATPSSVAAAAAAPVGELAIDGSLAARLQAFMDSTNVRLTKMESTMNQLSTNMSNQKALLGAVPNKVAATLRGTPVAGATTTAAAPVATSGAAADATDAFKKQFAEVLVPGFEKACRKMLSDLSASFDAGLQQRLDQAMPQVTAAAAAAAAAAVAALTKKGDKANDAASSVVQQTQAALAAQSALADELRKSIAAMQQTVATLASSAAQSGATAAAAAANVGRSLSTSPANPSISAAALSAAAASASPAAVPIEAQLAALAGADNKYTGKEEEAFTLVLGMTGVKEQRDMLQRLCAATSPDVVLSSDRPRISQPVVLSLLQQLGATLSSGTEWKIEWIKAAALALDPADAVLEQHLPGILGGLLRSLDKQYRAAQAANSPKKNELKLVLHIVNSLLIAK
jgi:WD40 repeat protein